MFSFSVRRISAPAFAPMLALALMGCTAAAQPVEQPPKASTPTQDACIAPGTWLDPARGETLTTPQALARLKDAAIVLLGETHVVPDHHRWHMQTVAQLYALNPDMILGFESFPRRVQPVLDQWVAGELTEQEFLERSEWDTVWRYDPDLYLPLFHFARINKVPMVALNVDRALLGQVSRLGWKNVPLRERRGIGNPARPPQGYIDMLGQVYSNHDNANGEQNGAPKAPGLNDPAFAGFVDVQVTWDRAMAEAAATALLDARASGRTPQLVGIMGRGHLDYDYGVPHQLADLGITDVQVAVPWDKLRPCAELKQSPPPTDLAFGLATTRDYFPEESTKPLLGVVIENGDDGVTVRAVSDGSVARAAGLKPGDVIERAAGQPVVKTAELIAVVQAMAPGTWLPLEVRRGAETLDIVARFPVDTP